MKAAVQIACLLVGIDARMEPSKGSFHPGHKILPHLPYELKKRLRNTRLLTPFDATGLANGGGLRVTPTQYGGDPTGRKDSTDALLKSVEFCVNASKIPPGKFPDGAADAGGCTVDLDGGEYLISQTLIIPTYVSNMRIQTGSLVANAKSSFWQTKPELLNTQTATAEVCTFSENRTDQWCQGMVAGPKPSSDTSAESCEKTCCSTPGCLAWQFCDLSAPCAATLPQGETCWLNPAAYDPTSKCKPSEPTNPNSQGWIGGSSKTPFTPAVNNFFLIQVGVA
jgi:hypothetical protein